MSFFKDTIVNTISPLSLCLDDVVRTSQATLKAAGVPEETRISLIAEMRSSTQALMRLMEKDYDDDELRTALRHFLRTRWTLIRNTTAAYCEYPESPMNVICQDLAIALAAGPEEAIARILMPTLTVDYYQGADVMPEPEDNLIELTEIDPENGDRRLKLRSFIISHDGTAIIPLAEWFKQQDATTKGPVYSHLYVVSPTNAHKPMPETEYIASQGLAEPNRNDFPGDRPGYDLAMRNYMGASVQLRRNYVKEYRASFQEKPLSNEDIELLKTAVLPESRVYIEEDIDKKSKLSKMQLLEAFQQVRKDCVRNGFTGKGSVDTAHKDLDPLLFAFFDKWNQAPQCLRNQILQLTDDRGRRLENYLWVWREYDRAKISTEEAARRERLATGYLCVDENSAAIMKIVNRHDYAHLFTGQTHYQDPDILRGNIAQMLEANMGGTINFQRFPQSHQRLSAPQLRSFEENMKGFDQMDSIDEMLTCKAWLTSDHFQQALKRLTAKRIETLLAEALNQNQPDGARALLRYFTLSKKLPDQALNLAIQKGWDEVVDALLARDDAKDLLNTPYMRDLYPLHLAVTQRNLETVQKLLDKAKLFPNYSFQTQYINYVTHAQKTAIDLAYESRNMPIVVRLIQEGAKFNCDFKELLLWAQGSGHTEILNLLLGQGKNIGILTRNLLNPMRLESTAVNALVQEVDNSLEILENVIKHYGSHPEDTHGHYLKAALRRFLKLRWENIRNTTAAYVEFPQSPLNQICQELALWVAKPGESIAQILMPTLKVEEYMTIDETLITLTEKPDRRLALHKFILSHDGTAVIPLKEWFELQLSFSGRGDLNFFLNHAYREGEFEASKAVPLTPQDLCNLRQTVLPDSKLLIDGIYEHQSQIAHPVSILARQCLENGASAKKQVLDEKNQVSYETGEMLAHPELIGHVTSFLQNYWNKLSPLERVRINNLVDPKKLIDNRNQTEDERRLIRETGIVPSPMNFEQYLLNIRYGICDETLTEADLARRDVLGRVTCIDTLGEGIKRIFDHPDYKPVFNCTQVHPLSPMKARILETLNYRTEAEFNHHRYGVKPLLGDQDSYINKQTMVEPIVNTEMLLELMEFTLPSELAAQLNGLDSKLKLSLLHQSLTQASSRAADALLDFFANPEQEIPLNTLHVAAKNGWSRVSDACFKRGKDLQKLMRLIQGTTPLHLAAQHGRADLVDQLLSHGADKNILDTNNNAAVMLAMHANHSNIVLKLLTHFGDIVLTEAQGQALIGWAISRDEREILSILIENLNLSVSQFQTSEGQSLLSFAVAHNDLKIITWLVEQGADITERFPPNNNSLLHWAVTHGEQPLVTMLIQRGADLTETYENNFGPPYSLLHKLATLDWPEAFSLLLDAYLWDDTLDINSTPPNSAGLTALYLAVQQRKEDNVKQLLEYGAIAPSLKLKHFGLTPLELALSYQYNASLLELFIRCASFSLSDLSIHQKKALFLNIVRGGNPATSLVAAAIEKNVLQQLAVAGFDGDNEGYLEACIVLQGHFDFFAHDELMTNPNLDKLRSYYNFWNLCSLANVEQDSDDALRLYAQAEVCRINHDTYMHGALSQYKKEQLVSGITSSEATGSRTPILNALKLHRSSHKNLFSRIGAASYPDSYNNLPAGFKNA